MEAAFSDGGVMNVRGSVCMQCQRNVFFKIYGSAKYFDREAKITEETLPSGSPCLLHEYLHCCFGSFSNSRMNVQKQILSPGQSRRQLFIL